MLFLKNPFLLFSTFKSNKSKYFPPPQEEKRKKCCYEKTAVQRNDQAVFPVHQPGDPILTPDPETGLV